MTVDRSHVFICKVGADDKRSLVSELMHLATEIDRDNLTAGVSGGYSSGSIYAYRHDPAITHDSYFEQLEAMLEAERNKEKQP